MSAASASSIPTLFKGTNRQLSIPSCLLQPTDLRKLYRLLHQKATEAAADQASSIAQQPGQTQAALEELRSSVRTAISTVTVRVQTKTGVWVASTTEDPLGDEQLPDGILKVEFDSAFQFRLRFNNLAPNNWFVVTLDLLRPTPLDMGTEPTPNLSTANIVAGDSTWANALWEELSSFFRQRATARGWLHSQHSYNVLVMLLGFPLSLIFVYRLDRLVRNRAALPQALGVAIDVYLGSYGTLRVSSSFQLCQVGFPKN